jgi:hypothetical protein
MKVSLSRKTQVGSGMEMKCAVAEGLSEPAAEQAMFTRVPNVSSERDTCKSG